MQNAKRCLKCAHFFCSFQDPGLKPREVHRGLEGLPEIPDGMNQGCQMISFQTKNPILGKF
jgi:hypothetical protein